MFKHDHSLTLAIRPWNANSVWFLTAALFLVGYVYILVYEGGCLLPTLLVTLKSDCENCACKK